MFIEEMIFYAPDADGGTPGDGNKPENGNTKDGKTGNDNDKDQNKDQNDDKGTQGNDDNKMLTEAEVKRLIQSETDRVRTEYSKKLKEKEAELEELRKEQMTEKERREYEERKRQEELEAKERELKSRELELAKIDALRDTELPLTFREFLYGENADEIKEKAEALKKLFADEVEKAVEARFKQSGRKPHDNTSDEREFYTRAEIESMSDAEIRANWDKILKSLTRLGS